MNAQLSEVPQQDVVVVDPVAAVKADIGEDEVALELGKQALLLIKQAKYITALQAALREAHK